MMTLIRLGFDAPTSLLERLQVRYAEPHRRYHTWAHVLACFDARDALLGRAAPTLPEVDLALLFHDAIYDPLAHDNEEASAALLVEEGRRAWLSEPLLQRARRLVLATAHRSPGDGMAAEAGEPDAGALAGIVVDADLSILGAAPDAFDDYERQVREEYRAIEDGAYARGRIAVLRGLLERPSIYATHQGRCLWEEGARPNLARSVSQLGRSLTALGEEGEGGNP